MITSKFSILSSTIELFKKLGILRENKIKSSSLTSTKKYWSPVGAFS